MTRLHPTPAPAHTRADRCCRMCGNDGLDPAGVVGGYGYAECGRCGFVFATGTRPETVAPLYTEGYRGPDGGAPEAGWADPSFLAPAFERLPDRPLTVLDFGAGDSFVPDLLRDEGHRVVAVDVAPPTRPHPDRLTGDLADLSLDPGRFDLIYSFQVFEHLPEPAPALDELLRLSKPGGLILIHTDMETPERDADGFEHWWYVMPPDHCSLYRHRTFDRFLEGTPHSIVHRDPKSVIIETRD